MKEPRPLPMGVTDFQEWSDRIISGAILPGGEEDPQTFKESLKVALANMLMHLGPTESHKPDAFFIHALRMGAVKQVAYSYIEEAKAAKDKAQLEKVMKAAEEKALNEKVSETIKEIEQEGPTG